MEELLVEFFDDPLAAEIVVNSLYPFADRVVEALKFLGFGAEVMALDLIEHLFHGLSNRIVLQEVPAGEQRLEHRGRDGVLGEHVNGVIAGDGIIEVRPGVSDLKNRQYAPIRIHTDQFQLFRGMAICVSDLPEGIDFIFHTKQPEVRNG